MQTSKLRKWLAVLIVLMGLMAVNFGIWQKERVLKQGAVMILQLAPVDPRSLMQGDYMALDYAITRTLQQTLYQQRQVCNSAPSVTCLPLSGKIVVAVNEQRQVTQARFDYSEPLKPNELRVNYHMNAGTLTVGSNAYFFQEGHGERFTHARYGAFRVGKDGTALLTAMLDKDGEKIQP